MFCPDPPAVTIHGLPDAHAALRTCRPVCLLSGPGAALYAGCLWWQALVAMARTAYPATPVQDLLDCGDSPGAAMAALRCGLRSLILDPACPALPAVRAAAAELGASIRTARPEALDLAQPGAERRLAEWLGSGAVPPPPPR